MKSVIELAYDLTHADGICVLVGVPAEKVTIYTLPIHFNKVLTGSHGGDAVPRSTFRACPAAGGWAHLVCGAHHARFPLEDVNTALDSCVAAMRAGCC